MNECSYLGVFEWECVEVRVCVCSVDFGYEVHLCLAFLEGVDGVGGLVGFECWCVWERGL
jgi:hypothetical protein